MIIEVEIIWCIKIGNFIKKVQYSQLYIDLKLGSIEYYVNLIL